MGTGKKFMDLIDALKCLREQFEIKLFLVVGEESQANFYLRCTFARYRGVEENRNGRLPERAGKAGSRMGRMLVEGCFDIPLDWNYTKPTFIIQNTVP